MARRGFFAELNHQAQQAERRRQQQAAAAIRAHAAAQREMERARAQFERAAAAAQRASAAERAEAQKIAARMHVEARTAEAAAMNAELAQRYEEIDNLLASTLEVDDFVDLESLKVTAAGLPPFDPGQLGVPVLPAPPPPYPPQPVYQEPAAPKGLFSGGRRKHEEAVARARAEHEVMYRIWHEQCARMHAAHTGESERRRQAEADRLARLDAAREAHRQQRDAEVAAHNQRIQQFIDELSFDVESAIQDYVGVVLANSVYPDCFPVGFEHRFDIGTRELTLDAVVPPPGDVPGVKEYRYVKAADEITHSTLPVKQQKDRYAGAVWQVAVRTLHEIFEADRAGKIRSVALTVSTRTIVPATGLPEVVPLAIVGADRDTFITFDLANVVPHATLAHLGAALSKSPFDLAPADSSVGVRVRKR